MIVKKVRREIVDKPKTWQIGDLVDYIRFPHNKNPQEKVAHAGSRNFLTSTHNGQKMEMIALAEESVHSNMPVQHWIFSWQEGEQPTREQVDEAVDIFLDHMGLTGHQTVYGLHYDTDNYHLHIAVNRMNEEMGKVVQPHKDLILMRRTGFLRSLNTDRDGSRRKKPGMSCWKTENWPGERAAGK